ncbi:MULTISPECIES: hypothetical protein [Erwinia]|uniref:Uncharacterized protein n=2 Tax=Erwinia TaxID=551 RepID=A0A014M231_9GAMM|nr:hypothetical protein [Erwinia mallotivora]EXU75896.1 hypothetical protein BG55_08930 [Erwinia mallotivora]
MSQLTVNNDLESDKFKIFFIPPLDAVNDGPILSGIRGYVPGKKTRCRQLKRQKQTALSVHNLIDNEFK